MPRATAALRSCHGRQCRDHDPDSLRLPVLLLSINTLRIPKISQRDLCAYLFETLKQAFSRGSCACALKLVCANRWRWPRSFVLYCKHSEHNVKTIFPSHRSRFG